MSICPQGSLRKDPCANRDIDSHMMHIDTVVQFNNVSIVGAVMILKMNSYRYISIAIMTSARGAAHDKLPRLKLRPLAVEAFGNITATTQTCNHTPTHLFSLEMPRIHARAGRPQLQVALLLAIVGGSGLGQCDCAYVAPALPLPLASRSSTTPVASLVSTTGAAAREIAAAVELFSESIANTDLTVQRRRLQGEQVPTHYHHYGYRRNDAARTPHVGISRTPRAAKRRRFLLLLRSPWLGWAVTCHCRSQPGARSSLLGQAEYVREPEGRILHLRPDNDAASRDLPYGRG